jgi:hypothetical protein
MITDKQRQFIDKYMGQLYNEAYSDEERAIIKYLWDMKLNSVGNKLSRYRPLVPGFTFIQEDFNETLQEIDADLRILYEEIEDIGDNISDAFNYNQNNKTRLKNRIVRLSSVATDLKMLNTIADDNIVYFTDTFTSYNNIDTNIITGTLANVSTSEGVATLARETSVGIPNTKLSIKGVNGNGTFGNNNVITADDIKNIRYKSDTLNPNNINAAIDNKPDTWFEYHAINIEDEARDVLSMFTDTSDLRLNQYNDKLRLRFIVDMGAVTPVNWIQLNPYI